MPPSWLSRLARRDPALKGLELILDPVALADAVAITAPGCLADTSRLTYVRYKPGRRCLVLLEASINDTRRQFVAVAHHAGHWAKELHRAARSHDSRQQSPLELIHDARVTLFEFPHDPDLSVLSRFGHQTELSSLLSRLFPDQPQRHDAAISQLAYKPGRRYVGCGAVHGQPQFVLKAYASREHPISKYVARPFESSGELRIPQRIARSRRHRIVAYEWVHGRVLSDAICEASIDGDTLFRVGRALAELHEQKGRGLSSGDPAEDLTTLASTANDVAFLLPELRSRILAVIARLASALSSSTTEPRPIHGDFYAEQVLVTDSQVGVVDFDQARLGDPARDVGNFVAKLKNSAFRSETSLMAAEQLASAFVAGYASRRRIDENALNLQTAAALVRCLPLPFRSARANWQNATADILTSIEQTLADRKTEQTTCRVVDPRRASRSPENAATFDERLPNAASALNLADAQNAFETLMPNLRTEYGRFQVTSARIVRHKPGRRCLIEYTLHCPQSQSADEELMLIGKMRAKGLDRGTYELQQRLWHEGFGDQSPDGISVPEPVGAIPEWGLWLQRMVPGSTAEGLLAHSRQSALVDRLAAALQKLHRAAIPARRKHTLGDELRILDERYRQTAAARPDLSNALSRIFELCTRVVARIPRVNPTGIHRDFYPAQVIVAGDRIYLLDLDLYAAGDPALDAGNFVGHLIEQGLRRPGESRRVQYSAERFAETYSAITGCDHDRVGAYTLLTLARHVALSTALPHRSHTTGELIRLCEGRSTCGRFRGEWFHRIVTPAIGSTCSSSS